ncbi:MAG: hypothetical protein GF409_04230 [Candidatus Omnitrophica bacterium]|nr:hypothetical protein [Candidatus Omnitrophota bacterium]
MKNNIIEINVDKGVLKGELNIPERARQLILFAHGSASGWQSPRNRHVASRFQKEGYATLLFDLLTGEEAREDAVNANFRFNIALLSQRMKQATRWASALPEASGVEIAYFGSSTGVAAAIISAVELEGKITSLVSRGGRSDMAEEHLPNLKSPILFVVGGNDPVVMDINRRSAKKLTCENSIEVIEGASHLFEEPGALDRVAELAADWYARHPGTVKSK